jgi:hypothetical protein
MHMVPSLTELDFSFKFSFFSKILVIVVRKNMLLDPIRVSENLLLGPIPVRRKWLLGPIRVSEKLLLGTKHVRRKWSPTGIPHVE